jgi:hypothetical protein
MAVKTRAQIKSENASDFPDNAAHLISPAGLRGQLDDIVDSALFPEDDVAMSPTTSPIVLLVARTTDGSPGGVAWAGGPGLVSVYGAWGTAQVQLAYSPDGGTTYIDTDGALFATNASLLLEYPAGKVRATISGVTTGTSLSSKLESTR